MCRHFYSISEKRSFLQNDVYTKLFTPSTYEECMNDGKVGRTNVEIKNHKNFCQKKFPALPSIKNGNKKEVLCKLENYDVNWVFKISVDKKNNSAFFENRKVELSSFTDSTVYMTWKAGKDKKKIYMSVNYIDGSFATNREGENSNYGTCSES